MTTRSEQPVAPVIRIVRKKVAGHAHHGGSWKIAYADFVTAMMAFFMVLWLLGLSDDIKRAIAAYFSDPMGMQNAYSKGGSGAGTSPMALPRVPIRMFSRPAQQHAFLEVAEKLRAHISEGTKVEGLGLSVEVVVEKEGMRVELSETNESNGLYLSGSRDLSAGGMHALELLAAELRTLPNPVIIEGHTDAKPYGRAGYSNWELSVDRANAARLELQRFGIPDTRIIQVRGFADRDLRIPGQPLAPGNRRLTVFLPYIS